METEASTLDLQPGELILSVGNDKRRPVQKWSGASVWPGRLTVTDRALYFEVSMLILDLISSYISDVAHLGFFSKSEVSLQLFSGQ